MSKKKKVYATTSFLLVEPGKPDRVFAPGDEVEDVGPGYLESLIRTNQCSYDPPAADVQPQPAPSVPLVADLEIDEAVKSALAKIGILTVPEVVAYGENHDGLTSIDGIDAGAEAAIILAIEAAKE